MFIKISAATRKKLREKHGVSEKEIRQCFLNRNKGFLLDIREKHGTIPPTQWFISVTNKNRELKILFILKDGEINIKTAYEPCDTERQIYKCKAE